MPVDVVQRHEQVGQPRRAPAAPIAVAVDGLAQERDFLAALIGQHAGFGQDVLRRTALLRAAGHGHDAVGAELVAADLDPQVGLEGRRPHGRIAERIEGLVAAADLLRRSLPAVQADGQLAASTRAGALDQFRRLLQLPRTDDQIDVRRTIEDQPLVLLGHAAQDADDLFGMTLLVAPELAQGAVDLVLGVLPHAAGIEQDRVGLLDGIDQLVAVLPEAGHDHFAVQHIHLAADGLDVEVMRRDGQNVIPCG